MNVNLGCGKFPKPGFVNVDREAGTGVDVVHDLNEFPYPFPDGAATLVEMDHVLEHLREPFRVMKEIHRILRPGGRVVVRVPHFSRGFTHPEHKRGFSSTFPFYFSRDFKGEFMGVDFVHVSTKMSWLAQIYLLRTIFNAPTVAALSAINSILNALANQSPHFCSKFWCYWVGGFDEIAFDLQRPSSGSPPAG